MPRKPRIQYPNAIYHVITRGDGRREIFFDNDHYQRLTDGLADEVQRSGWIVPAFCWMPNHIHLLIQTPLANLSRGMQHLLSGYANWFAKRNRRSGHLFQGRFKSYLVQDETYYWSLSRYIHLNPVNGRRPLVEKPEDWKHGTFAGYVREASRFSFVDYQAIWNNWAGEFGGRDPKISYQKYVRQGLSQEVENPLESAWDDWVIGKKAFLKKVLKIARKNQPQSNSRLVRRTRAIDPSEVFTTVAREFGVDPTDYRGYRASAAGREMAALLCRQLTPATLAELSETLGLAHKDSSANLIKKAKRLERQSKTYAKQIQRLTDDLLKTENQV